jgi:hypothetical protein
LEVVGEVATGRVGERVFFDVGVGVSGGMEVWVGGGGLVGKDVSEGTLAGVPGALQAVIIRLVKIVNIIEI